MNSPSDRSSFVRSSAISLVILVALAWAWLFPLRRIETAGRNSQKVFWARLEGPYRSDYLRATKGGNSQEIARTKYWSELASSERIENEQPVGAIPYPLTEFSAVLTIDYAIAMMIALHYFRARHAGRRWAVDSRLWRRSGRPCFFAWVAAGFVAPIAIGAIGITFEVSGPIQGELPWPAYVLNSLCWYQTAHGIAGVAFLGGRRWEALGLAIFSILTTAYVGFFCMMAVTGTWL